MIYKRLGKSDLNISEVSFGCMSLGTEHSSNSKILRQAVDKGINFFDTADLYDQGENEITVGKAFKEIRNKVIIATKVGNQWKKDGSGWDWNPSKKYILSAVEESLRRLQTDYIDLYQLHGGTLEDPIDETIEAFEILKQAGKIRYYGISSIRPNVIREYVERSSIVSVMMQYSLLDRRPEEECLDLLNKNTIGVLARGSLAKGLLVDKKPSAFLAHTEAQVEKATSAVETISTKVGSKTATAIKYVLVHPAVTSAVVGIRTEQHLLEAIKVSTAQALTEDDVQFLRSSVKEFLYEQNR